MNGYLHQLAARHLGVEDHLAPLRPALYGPWPLADPAPPRRPVADAGLDLDEDVRVVDPHEPSAARRPAVGTSTGPQPETAPRPRPGHQSTAGPALRRPDPDGALPRPAGTAAGHVRQETVSRGDRAASDGPAATSHRAEAPPLPAAEGRVPLATVPAGHIAPQPSPSVAGRASEHRLPATGRVRVAPLALERHEPPPDAPSSRITVEPWRVAAVRYEPEPVPLVPLAARRMPQPRSAVPGAGVDAGPGGVEQTIEVTIGRVEIRATPAAVAPPASRPAPAPRTMSLDAYLRRRAREPRA